MVCVSYRQRSGFSALIWIESQGRTLEGQAGDNFWLNELYKLTRGSK